MHITFLIGHAAKLRHLAIGRVGARCAVHRSRHNIPRAGSRGPPCSRLSKHSWLSRHCGAERSWSTISATKDHYEILQRPIPVCNNRKATESDLRLRRENWLGQSK